MSTGLLDYHFGWRWLLPYVPGQVISLQGFGEEECLFWQNEINVGSLSQQSKVTSGCIIDADHFPLSLLPGYISTIGDATQWVAVIGTGRYVSFWRRYLSYLFPLVNEYGPLPSVNSRLVVPLNDTQCAVSALALHRPGRRIARYGVWLAAMLARLNVLSPLRRRVLLIASRRDYTPMGAVYNEVSAQSFGKITDYALYLGTPDDKRKTVVLPLCDPASEWLIKVGNSEKARRSLRNEAVALQFLNDTPLKNNVPLLRGVIVNPHCVALHQEYRPRGKATCKIFDQAVVDFLVQLSILGRRPRSLQLIMGEMFPDENNYPKGGEDGAYAVVWRWLQRQAESGAIVWECQGHGDFAPWNCMWTGKGLFVYDWEESSKKTLAFSDAFYYVMAPILHLSSGTSTLEDAMMMALRLGGEVAKLGNLPQGNDIKIHFALWLLLNQGKHPYIPMITANLSKCILNESW